MTSRCRQAAVDLRPHAKTHKTREIAMMQLERGAVGITVAKTAEAEAYVDAGFGDVFIATCVVGPGKIARIRALNERCRLTVGVDSAGLSGQLARHGGSPSVRLRVRIEVDTGHRRCGVRTPAEAVAVAEAVSGLPSLVLDGVYTHEGHLYAIPNADERRQRARAVAAHLADIAAALRDAGYPANVVSAGSTPGAPFVGDMTGISEFRPGNYVFLDRMQAALGSDLATCALTVHATVTCAYADGRRILDCGSKALAGDRPFADGTCGAIAGHPGARFDRFSEEHGVVLVDGPDELAAGERVRVIPNHACTCVNMYSTLVAAENDTVIDRWDVMARGLVT